MYPMDILDFWLGFSSVLLNHKSEPDQVKTQPKFNAVILHITEEHRLKRKQKILRRLKHGY